jgi:hypothetical protein
MPLLSVIAHAKAGFYAFRQGGNKIQVTRIAAHMIEIG